MVDYFERCRSERGRLSEGRYAIPGGYGSHEGFNHDEKRKLGGYTYRSLRSKRRYA